MSLYVQDIASAANGSTTATISLAISTAPTAGNALLLEVIWNGTGTLPSTLTDSQSNTWTRTVNRVGTGSPKLTVAQYLCNPTTALANTDTITAPWTIGNTNMRMWQIRELTGTVTFDQSATNQATTASASLSVGPTGTTTVATETAWASFATNTQQTTWTQGGGWSLPTSSIRTTSVGSLISLVSEYLDITSTQTVTATGTVGTSAVNVEVVGTYYGSAVASSPDMIVIID